MKRVIRRAITVGDTFGRWTVKRQCPTINKKTGLPRRGWICVCICGNEKLVYEGNLHSGVSQSCGCSRSEETVKRNHARLLIPYECRTHGIIAKPYILTKVTNGKQRACPVCRRSMVQRTRDELRAAVIAGYGGHCACCGEANPGFLTIDHIYGLADGQRRSDERGTAT